MKIQSKALSLAHAVKKQFSTWKEAICFAWNKVRLEKKLAEKICYFEFKKKSTGEIREALATTNKDNYDYEFKGGSWTKWNIVRFWDINLNDWRCLDVRTLIKIHW